MPHDPPEPVLVPPNDWASLERLQAGFTEVDFQAAKSAPNAKVAEASVQEAYLGELGFPGMTSFAATLIYGGGHPLAGKQLDAGGYPGVYVVTMIMTRRGAPDIPNLFVTDERQLEGDSHLILPEGLRGEVVVDGKTQHLAIEHALEDGKAIAFTLLANRWGRLAKIQTRVEAENAKEASRKAYRAIIPVLCDVSFRYEIPLDVLQVNVVEASTLTAVVEKALDFPLKELSLDFLGESINYGDFPQYSFLTYLYKEGVSSPNMAYGFLCFFRVIEGIVERRRERIARQAGKKKSEVPRPDAFADNEVVEGADAKHFPEALRGESFHDAVKQIDSTRVKVAHAYLHEETAAMGDIDTLGDRLDVEEELSALRFQARHMARSMMLNEYWASQSVSE